MDSPQTLEALTPRSLQTIALMTHAAQANLVALRVAWCRRIGVSQEGHDIKTPSPGTVRHFRETLLDRAVIREYSTNEVLLRLRQIWGEFCALCWLFPHVDPQSPITFDPLPADQAVRCPTLVLAKLEEVQAGLWRIRHEQQFRHDPGARKDPAFLAAHRRALDHPITILGQDIRLSTDEEIFCSACEHAGMLAALRWVADDRWDWEAPGIMDVTLRPEL